MFDFSTNFDLHNNDNFYYLYLFSEPIKKQKQFNWSVLLLEFVFLSFIFN